MSEIIPGILEKEWEDIEKKLMLVRPFTQTVHIDLLDGKFAENTTFMDTTLFKKYSDTFFLELHMMVDDPIEYLTPWANAGFKRFVGHIEKMSDPIAFIAKAEDLGEVGLAIDAQTPIEKIAAIDLFDLDSILIMTINAGFSGQQFMPEMLEKVKKIRAKSDILPIEVDGGINERTIKQAYIAGANRFVTTSALFQTNDILKQYNLLLEQIDEKK